MPEKPVRNLSTERMKRAHALIKEKKYQEARAILVKLNNSTARKWVKQIDHILLEQDDPFAETAEDQETDQEASSELHPEVVRPVDTAKAHGTPDVVALWDDRIRAEKEKNESAKKPLTDKEREQVMTCSIVAVVFLFIVIVLLAIGSSGGDSEEGTPTEEPTPYVVEPSRPPATSRPAPRPTQRPSSPYTCDCSKTCDEIASCDEAYYQLNTCGCSRRDSDKDGVPCELPQYVCPGR